MIKHFKQHVLPFVIATRKIFTIVLSIIFYQHAYDWVQILGIIIVFTSVTIEFIIELVAESKREKLKTEALNRDERIDEEENMNNGRN